MSFYVSPTRRSPQRPAEGSGSPDTGAAGSCEPPRRCLRSSTGLLPKAQASLLSSLCFRLFVLVTCTISFKLVKLWYAVSYKSCINSFHFVRLVLRVPSFINFRTVSFSPLSLIKILSVLFILLPTADESLKLLRQ